MESAIKNPHKSFCATSSLIFVTQRSLSPLWNFHLYLSYTSCISLFTFFHKANDSPVTWGRQIVVLCCWVIRSGESRVGGGEAGWRKPDLVAYETYEKEGQEKLGAGRTKRVDQRRLTLYLAPYVLLPTWMSHCHPSNQWVLNWTHSLLLLKITCQFTSHTVNDTRPSRSCNILSHSILPSLRTMEIISS